MSFFIHNGYSFPAPTEDDLKAMRRFAEPQTVAVIKPKPHCPTQYGIRTRAEVETEGLPMPSRLTEFAGRTTTKAMLDPFAKSWLLQFDDELVSVPSAWLSRTISHAWVDNGGMLKSFCKVCDCDAEWCRDTYQYVAKARTE